MTILDRLNRMGLLLCALVASVGTAPLAAQSRLPQPLETYVRDSMTQAEVPGLALTVVHGEDPPIVQGFGVRRLGRPEPVDGDTIFNIASLTKSFTAASAAALVDEHRLAWDDRVSRLLPQVEFSDPWLTRQITIADLLSHRTGLESANTAWYLARVSRPEILRRVRYLQPAAPFRTEQTYNNGLYIVAGEAIAAAAGTSFEDHVRARLLRPLGMTRTLIGVPPTAAGNSASPHAVVDGRHQPIPAGNYVTTSAAGGVESTARDMVRWLRFQLGDGSFEGQRILSAAAMDAMHHPWVMIATTPAMRSARQVQFFGGYGLGWNVMDYRGHKMLWHSGNADGMPSFMALLPNERVGVFVTMNSWIAPFLHLALVSRIFDFYLELPTRDYAAETLTAMRAAASTAPAAAAAATAPALPPLELAAYAGSYRHDLYGPIFVRRTRDGLLLKLGAGDEADLRPLSRDTFEVRWRDRAFAFADTRATFGLDDQGLVSRLTMRLRRDTIEAVRDPEG